MILQRDGVLERDFLDAAEKRARFQGLGFKEAVAARLTAGERLYGNRALGTPLSDLLREIREEGLDLGAWSCLAAEAEEIRDCEPELRGRIHLLLQEIAAHGVVVDRLVDEIRDLL